MTKARPNCDGDPSRDPVSPVASSADCPETLPPNEATKRDEQRTPADPDSDVPDSDLIAPTLVHGDSDPACADASHAEPLATHAPTKAGVTGVGDTLDFVLREVKRKKAAAVLHTQVGDYEIERELGRGGMGVVYKARHRQLRRDVALKMILAGKHAGPEQLERFLTEARAVAQLQHPNIVQIFDIGEHEGLPYFSLEFVDGESLQQHLNRQPQPPDEAGRLLELLCRAMQYAHDHGVLHRDLKPANVLMTKEGVPKISDFGLAKKVDDDESASTRTGTVMGTPSYMSPEQAMGMTHEVGPAADQYTLGAILYETLTGRPPFLAAKAVDTVLQVIQNEPIPPRQLQPAIPVDLETICLKALQKEPHKRYASCMDLAEDLRRFREGVPIEARPISGSERLWRWCRRNPRLATLSATVAVLLLAVAGTSTFAYFRIASEQAQTLKERAAAIDARDLAQRNARDAEAARKVADERALAENAARKLAEEKEAVARAAEDRAEKSAIIADEQRNLALVALRSLVTSVQDKLKDREDMRNLQQELLDVAMNGLNQVASSAEKAGLVDRSMGNAQQRMGDLFQQTGRTEEALKQYELAQNVFRRLATEKPQEPESEIARYNLAIMLEKIGDVKQQLGDAETTRANYLEALALRQGLHDDLVASKIKSSELKPSVIQMSLATSFSKMGLFSLLLGDPSRAHEYYLKALQVREQVAMENASNPQVKQMLASSYVNLGETAFRLHDVEAARRYHSQAIVLLGELAGLSPQSVSIKQSLAASYGLMGDVELLSKNTAAALEAYAQALDLHRQLVAGDADNAKAKFGVSQSFYRLGSAYLMLGDKEKSRANFGESLAIREAMAEADPNNLSRRVELLLVRARCGDHRGASELCDQVLAQTPKDPAMLYYVGCGKALCAAALNLESPEQPLSDAQLKLQDEYASAAVKILRRAVTGGFGDVVSLQNDPDLAPLQEHTEFRQLLDGLKRKQ